MATLTITEPETGRASLPRAASMELLLAEQLITERLKRQGDGLVYSLLLQKLGKDPQKEARSAVMRACRRFENKKNAEGVACVLATVRGQGIRWLTNEEVALRGPKATRRIHHISKRAGAEQATIAGSALDPEFAKMRDVHMGISAAVQTISGSKGVKKLAAAYDGSGRLLGVENTLKVFAK